MTETDSANEHVKIKPSVTLCILRWLDVGMASALGSMVVLLGLFVFRDKVKLLLNLPLLPVALAPLCVAVGLTWWRRPPNRAQFYLTYPSYWTAGLLGCSLLLVLFGLSSYLQREFNLPVDSRVGLLWFGAILSAPVALLSVSSLCLLTRRGFRLRSAQVNSITTFADPIDSWQFTRLVEWLKDDNRICDPEHDLFSHNEIAERVAGRLLSPAPPAQAVVGRLGSGKSSVLGLVNNVIERRKWDSAVIMVDVELWSFANSTAAVDFILSKLIERLSSYVDVTALTGLPNAYLEAMNAAGGAFSFFSRLQGLPNTPRSILQRIDTIARTIGVRLVLWVEDLERFCASGVSQDGIADESPEDMARLAPIRALLHNLDSLRSITVVTATTTLRNRFDLEKIARFVEEIPELHDRTVARVVSSFRKGCRSKVDYVDPASKLIRSELDLLAEQDLWLRPEFGGSRIHTIRDAVVTLCRTPRTLKQGLRSCLNIWEALAGEIDFDDLLIMSLLREASPAAFVLVGEARSFMSPSSSVRHFQKAIDDTRKSWEERLDHLQLPKELHESVRQIVEFVFDAKHQKDKPQGLAGSTHTNYWQRFLSRSIPSGQGRDQDILRVVTDDESDSALLNLLERPSMEMGVVDFALLLTFERVTRLLLPLVQRRLQDNAQNWPDSDPPGLVSLWNIWLKHHRYGRWVSQIALEKIKEAIEVAVPCNLSLLQALDRYFIGESGQDYQLLVNINGCDQAAEARQLLWRLLVHNYVGNPDRLASALREAPRWTLFRLTWLSERLHQKTMNQIPFQGWNDLASTILDAVEQYPEVMLPQLFELVTKSIDSPARVGSLHEQQEFDPELSALLFSSTERVLSVVAGTSTPDKASELCKSILLGGSPTSPQ